MDRSAHNITINLRDCQRTVPRLVHSRPLPSLDTKVLLVADINNDGADEVLVLLEGGGGGGGGSGDAKQQQQQKPILGFFPLRNEKEFESFAAPLAPSSQLYKFANGSVLAPTFGADGTLRNGKNSNLMFLQEQEELEEERHQEKEKEKEKEKSENEKGEGEKNKNNNSDQDNISGCTNVSSSSGDDGDDDDDENNDSEDEDEYNIGGGTNFDHQRFPPGFTQIRLTSNSLVSSSSQETLGAEQNQLTPNSSSFNKDLTVVGAHCLEGVVRGGGLVLVLMEGYVIHLRGNKFRHNNNNSDNYYSLSSYYYSSSFSTNTTSSGGGNEGKTTRGRGKNNSKNNRKNQRKDLIELNFSHAESIWEIPWNCCSSAIEQNSFTVYVGFPTGLILALPFGKHFLQQAKQEMLEKKKHSSNNTMTTTNTKGGKSKDSSLSNATEKTIGGESGGGRRRSTGEEEVVGGDSNENQGGGGGGEIFQNSSTMMKTVSIIPASSNSSALSVNEAPSKIAPLFYGDKQAVLIATKGNVVLVDANTGFAKASFSQQISNIQLLWRLQVHCTSLEVFQASVYSSSQQTCWCIVCGPEDGNNNSVLVFSINSSGDIERSEFRLSSHSIVVPPPTAPSTSATTPAAAAGAGSTSSSGPSSTATAIHPSMSTSSITSMTQQQHHHHHHHHHHHQVQHQLLPGDAPKFARATINDDDEFVVIITSENGSITLCDRSRQAVHVSLRNSHNVNKQHRTQSIHEIRPLSLRTMASSPVLMGVQQNHQPSSSSPHTSSSGGASGSMLGGIGGGGGSTSSLSSFPATPIRQGGGGGGGVGVRRGSGGSGGTPSAMMMRAVSSSAGDVIELLLVDNCSIRHLAVRHPKELHASRSLAKNMLERTQQVRNSVGRYLPKFTSSVPIPVLANAVLSEKQMMEKLKDEKFKRNLSMDNFDDDN